jgi:small conductance mechanosensitive channel
MENYSEYVELLKQVVVEYGLQVIGAILALVIGLWIIKALTGGLSKLMKNRDVDSSLRPFLRTLFNITLKLLLVISIASMIGIPMTSFIAIMGAAGLAIGMALAGTLKTLREG